MFFDVSLLGPCDATLGLSIFPATTAATCHNHHHNHNHNHKKQQQQLMHNLDVGIFSPRRLLLPWNPIFKHPHFLAVLCQFHRCFSSQLAMDQNSCAEEHQKNQNMLRLFSIRQLGHIFLGVENIQRRAIGPYIILKENQKPNCSSLRLRPCPVGVPKHRPPGCSNLHFSSLSFAFSWDIPWSKFKKMATQK